MMKLKISGTSKMLALSIAFSMCLLLVRFLYSASDYYRFYIWNTFLAIIPYALSTQILKSKKIRAFTILLLVGWFLFLPNAPYLITDLFHYEQQNAAPYWYDLFIVIIGSWNGLILGLISLLNVEQFLARYFTPVWVKVSVFASLLLCSYGVFIGRFNRFNSWDIISAPRNLVVTSAHHILLPMHYPKVWVFTLLFTTMLTLMYYTLKKIPGQNPAEK